MRVPGTLGDYGGALTSREVSESVFRGCERRTEIATYLAAGAWENRVKAFTWGAAVGVAAAAVAAYFFLPGAGAALLGAAAKGAAKGGE